MRSRYDGGSTSAFLSQADPRKLPLPDPMSGSTTFLPLTPAHSGWLGLREMGLRRAVPRFFDEPDGVFWSPPSQALKRFCLQFRGRYEELLEFLPDLLRKLPYIAQALFRVRVDRHRHNPIIALLAILLALHNFEKADYLTLHYQAREGCGIMNY